jgi:carnitine O-acetyltransferase
VSTHLGVKGKLIERLFNFSRIPLPGSDAFSAIAPHALHTTLIVDDFYYSIDVFSPPSGGAYPEPLSVVEIEARIRAAVEDAKTRKDGGEQPPMVGILTGDERDTWTKVNYKSINTS